MTNWCSYQIFSISNPLGKFYLWVRTNWEVVLLNHIICLVLETFMACSHWVTATASLLINGFNGTKQECSHGTDRNGNSNPLIRIMNFFPLPLPLLSVNTPLEIKLVIVQGNASKELCIAVDDMVNGDSSVKHQQYLYSKQCYISLQSCNPRKAMPAFLDTTVVALLNEVGDKVGLFLLYVWHRCNLFLFFLESISFPRIFSALSRTPIVKCSL